VNRAQPVEIELGRLFSASAVTLPRQIAKAVSGPLSTLAVLTKQVGHRIVPAGRQAHLARVRLADHDQAGGGRYAHHSADQFGEHAGVVGDEPDRDPPRRPSGMR